MIVQTPTQVQISRKAWTALVLLAVAHCLLALAFASLTPYRQAGAVLINPSFERDIGAPDERQHANYIGRLMRGDGLPVFDPHSPTLYEDYQYHQPPLYYVIATGWGKILGVSDVTAPDAGIRLRSVNAFVGAVGVLGAFFFAWWGYGDKRVALLAAAIVALLPMNIALSGAISNDPLLIALCSWVLALCARAIRAGWNLRLGILTGALTGLAIITKTNGVSLLPALLAACLLPQALRPNQKIVAGAAIALVVVIGGWWVRNMQLYGDPLAMRAFNEAFTNSAQKTLFTESIIPQMNPGANPELTYWLNWVGFWTVRSFVGVFGYMDIWLTTSGRQTPDPDANRLYFVALAMLAVGAIGYFIDLRARSRDESTQSTRGIDLLSVIFTGVVVVLFLRFNNQYFQAQARYIFPALAPIATGIALGWQRLLHNRPMIPLAIFVLLFGGINAFALSRMESQFADRIAAGRALSPNP